MIAQGIIDGAGRERDIRRGVLIQAFPAPSNIFTLPSGEVVEVNSEAKVPGHIVLTRILSLLLLAIVPVCR